MREKKSHKKHIISLKVKKFLLISLIDEVLSSWNFLWQTSDDRSKRSEYSWDSIFITFQPQKKNKVRRVKSSNSYSHTEETILRSSAQKKSSHNTRKTRKSRRSGREKNTSRIKIRFWCWKEEEKGETRTRRTSERERSSKTSQQLKKRS